ncbi:cytochrome c4 [Ferrovum sp. PN-J185]|uniref:c-type cytochrome n=1 Tax=Ferrovum sp. PN-J185 TaxID=1356306 RepID=UPI00079CAE55|nr:c-type cytochrome [Ferrovum sp. PN-J185]KXW55575.1 cytochrome c4 precursor [Ferrovum sp. PN-J185]MCC6068922.1 cytochrome c4 [Ferrovum sp. PN-J185]MDE1891214.1 cytochrome c4 [Betaproteobacteria bacterium]MDE2056254.1 cytochrome c4 [Betaproteobacteria bacterium]
MFKTILTLSLLVLTISTYAQNGDPAKGKVVASGVCYACHGLDGVSPIPTQPHLAGQVEEYIVKQLENMKSINGAPPERENLVMSGIVPTLSDADMKNVAAWYAEQKPNLASAHSKQSVAVGEHLWRAGDTVRGIPACASCHGPTGAGVPSQYPRLAGQYQEYTETQLLHFKSGTRHNSAIMMAIASRLSNDEIKALADFTAGLR